MKTLVVVLSVVFSSFAFAKSCVQPALGKTVCQADLVYFSLNNESILRGEVIALESSGSRILVRNQSSRSLSQVSLGDLFLTKGCIGEICVGSHVYLGTKLIAGATVLAINSSRNLAIIKSQKEQQRMVVSTKDLLIAH